MSLWLILTAMIAVASVIAAAPFIRRYERKKFETNSSLAVLRDQLREVDLEAEQGAIDAQQAEAARIEIKRRMLSGDDAEGGYLPGLSGAERTFAAISVSAVVVLGSVILFVSTADFDSGPSLGPVRMALPDERGDAPAAIASAPAGAGIRPQSNVPPVDELVQRLVTRLQRNPKDVEGWRMLGWSYFSTNRFNESAAAYAKAIEIDPNSIDYRDGRLESLVRAANGVVTGDVRVAVEETLRLQPGNVRARFLKGLGYDQAGNRSGAEAEWKDILRDIDPNDPWVVEINQRLSGTSKPPERSIPAQDAAQIPAPSGGPSAVVSVPSGGRGPSADDVKAAEAMSAGDRASMIRRMVDSLADRLDASPRDADGWIKLVRSLVVLGDIERAKKAVEKGVATFADDPNQSQRIKAVGLEFGLAR